MKQVTVHEAKTHLSRLIRDALEGEEIVIARGDKPVVRIVPVPEAVGARRLGGASGVVRSIASDFDEPVEDFEPYAP